jgi:preprotein translocase subunit SecE
MKKVRSRPMAKDQGVTQTTLRPRTAPRSAAAPESAKKPFNLVQFAREVRSEARKVTWTSWRETWITSAMVGIMVVAAALFFFGVDAIFGFAMEQILKLGSAGV